MEMDSPMTDDGNAGGADRARPWLAIGGVLAAIGASSCCVLPFLFFVLGVSGAWIGNLTALAPYQPIFLAVAAGFIGLGFWRVYRRPVAIDCAQDQWCARPRSQWLTKAALWAATALVVLALAFPYFAPALLSA
jgi:mercuric ion transport protein